MKLFVDPVRFVHDSAEDLAGEFHVASRNSAAHKNNPRAHLVHYEERIQKLVENAALHFEGTVRVELPLNAQLLNRPLGECICSRTSSRQLDVNDLSVDQLGSILLHANAVRNDRELTGGEIHRNAPSSGNLGSVEIFAAISRVGAILPGLYHFDTAHHDLALMREGDFGHWLKSSVFYQPEFGNAAVTLFLVSSVQRLTAKYGLRGYRLALLDVGHVSQNIQLIATALGLRTCATAGFIDDAADEFVGVDGLNVATMLVVGIG